MNYEQLGANIRENRIKKNISIAVLAEKSGISTNFLGKIERAQSIPSLETLVSVSNALEISVDLLLGNCINDNSASLRFIDEIILNTQRQKDFLKFIELNARFF